MLLSIYLSLSFSCIAPYIPRLYDCERESELTRSIIRVLQYARATWIIQSRRFPAISDSRLLMKIARPGISWESRILDSCRIEKRDTSVHYLKVQRNLVRTSLEFNLENGVCLCSTFQRIFNIKLTICSQSFYTLSSISTSKVSTTNCLSCNRKI